MTKKHKIMGARTNFLGIDAHCGWGESEVVVLPAPLETTVSYMKGTGRGPAAMIQASHQVEFYDDELRTETYRKGIATLPALRFQGKSLKASVQLIQDGIIDILQSGKKPLLIGGEHTVSIGAIQACHQMVPDLSVLHLDAHTDLRESYEGSPYSHACVMARVKDICPFVSIGIRSLCIEEADLIKTKMFRVIDSHQMRTNGSWMDESINSLSDSVYITLDLDVFDPSIMPAVGTPEPGGMGWRECLDYMHRVFREKRIIGMDVVELAPRQGTEHGVFTAAKLTYRLIGYWLENAH
jgi:agmatinase